MHGFLHSKAKGLHVKTRHFHKLAGHNLKVQPQESLQKSSIKYAKYGLLRSKSKGLQTKYGNCYTLAVHNSTVQPQKNLQKG
jgi:hypothetical protein